MNQSIHPSHLTINLFVHLLTIEMDRSEVVPTRTQSAPCVQVCVSPTVQKRGEISKVAGTNHTDGSGPADYRKSPASFETDGGRGGVVSLASLPLNLQHQDASPAELPSPVSRAQCWKKSQFTRCSTVQETDSVGSPGITTIATAPTVTCSTSPSVMYDRRPEDQNCYAGVCLENETLKGKQGWKWWLLWQKQMQNLSQHHMILEQKSKYPMEVEDYDIEYQDQTRRLNEQDEMPKVQKEFCRQKKGKEQNTMNQLLWRAHPWGERLKQISALGKWGRNKGMKAAAMLVVPVRWKVTLWRGIFWSTRVQSRENLLQTMSTCKGRHHSFAYWEKWGTGLNSLEFRVSLISGSCCCILLCPIHWRASPSITLHDWINICWI